MDRYISFTEEEAEELEMPFNSISYIKSENVTILKEAQTGKEVKIFYNELVERIPPREEDKLPNITGAEIISIIIEIGKEKLKAING